MSGDFFRIFRIPVAPWCTPFGGGVPPVLGYLNGMSMAEESDRTIRPHCSRVPGGAIVGVVRSVVIVSLPHSEGPRFTTKRAIYPAVWGRESAPTRVQETGSTPDHVQENWMMRVSVR